VAADLEEIRSRIVRRGSSIFNITARKQGLPAALDRVKTLAAALPEGLAAPEAWKGLDVPEREGLGLPTQVNYVGEAVLIPDGVLPRPGAALVAARRVRNAYLWERVRVTGGAYGSFCIFDSIAHALIMLSYRDPHIARTVNAYHAAADYLKSDQPSRDELEKAIIGTIGDMDQHMLPDAKGFASLTRRLTGETDEFRQKLREEALAATADDFRAFGAAVGQLAAKGRLCVLGAKQALEEANLGLAVRNVL
jgi:hypothetical protein